MVDKKLGEPVIGSIVRMNEGQWRELKESSLKQDGWFIPSLSVKYKVEDEKVERLKRLCASWVKDNFGYEVAVEGLEVLEQENIDRALGLVGIRFEFSDGNVIGDSVAYLEEI